MVGYLNTISIEGRVKYVIACFDLVSGHFPCWIREVICLTSYVNVILWTHTFGTTDLVTGIWAISVISYESVIQNHGLYYYGNTTPALPLQQEPPIRISFQLKVRNITYIYIYSLNSRIVLDNLDIISQLLFEHVTFLCSTYFSSNLILLFWHLLMFCAKHLRDKATYCRPICICITDQYMKIASVIDCIFVMDILLFWHRPTDWWPEWNIRKWSWTHATWWG